MQLTWKLIPDYAANSSWAGSIQYHGGSSMTDSSEVVLALYCSDTGGRLDGRVRATQQMTKHSYCHDLLHKATPRLWTALMFLRSGCKLLDFDTASDMAHISHIGIADLPRLALDCAAGQRSSAELTAHTPLHGTVFGPASTSQCTNSAATTKQ